METFAKRLASALESRRMTAAELSRKIGVNEGTISNYKKGVYEPKQRRLDEISRILNVSIAWLMGADVPFSSRVENEASNVHTNKGPIAAEELRIINEYRNLDDRGKKAVLDTIQREKNYIENNRLLKEQADDEIYEFPLVASSGEKAIIKTTKAKLDADLAKLKPSNEKDL